LHEIIDDKGIRVVNFARSRTLFIKATVFPHRSIHKHTWTSYGRTHRQIHYVLIDRRRHSNIVDVRSFTGADCDTDQFLLVTKVRDRLSVSKRTAQEFDIERLNMKKLNNM